MIDYNFHIKEKDKCIILSPHADDESIGCGGLLLKYPQNFKVVVLTDGAKGGNDIPEHIIKTRLEELKNAMNYAKVENYENLMIPDREVHKYLYKLNTLELEQYDYVFVPNPNEFHVDHHCIYDKVKQLLKYTTKTRIITYEVWSPIPNPNIYTDISDIIEEKANLIKNYKSQIDCNAYDTRTTSLNYYRGLKSNHKYAEAYYEEKTEVKCDIPLLRIIITEDRFLIFLFCLKISFKRKIK